MKEVKTSHILIGAACLAGLTYLAYQLLKEDGATGERAPAGRSKKSPKDEAPNALADARSRYAAIPSGETAPRRAKPLAKPQMELTKTEHGKAGGQQTVQVPLETQQGEFPLKLGDKGEKVERLQVWLTRNHGHFGILSGEFDQQTLERVRRYLKVEEVSETLFNKLNMAQPVYAHG